MVCSSCSSPDHNKATCPVLQKVPEPIPIQVHDNVLKKVRILGRACARVADGLGKGHAEKTYQEAMSQVLQDLQIRHTMEVALPIVFEGRDLGGNHSTRIDIQVDAAYLDFIYELKATPSTIKQEELWQLIRYLKKTAYGYGAVVNFNTSLQGELEIKLVIAIDDEYYLFDYATGYGTLIPDAKLLYSYNFGDE